MCGYFEHAKSSKVVVYANIGSVAYMLMLSEILALFVKESYPTGLFLQQDSAVAHISKYTEECIAEKKSLI